ncbi:MAG: hypothetical protein ABIJ57_05145, partial [Pseudomonadota bacterium]
AEQKRRDEGVAREREKKAAEEAARREEKAREEGKAQGRKEAEKEIPPAAKLPPPVSVSAPDTCLDILTRVKQALEETGCEICTARLVLDMEIAKLQEGENDADGIH